MVVATSSRNS